MTPGTVIYESAAPLTPGARFMAFLTLEGPVRGPDGAKTGKTGFSMLPVRFMSGTAEGARDKALAFWDDEKGKEAAKLANIAKAHEASAAKRKAVTP